MALDFVMQEISRFSGATIGQFVQRTDQVHIILHFEIKVLKVETSPYFPGFQTKVSFALLSDVVVRALIS